VTYNTAINVDCICDEHEFARLADRWNRLADQSNDQSVFLRHEWFDAAWQWLKQNHSLHLIVVRTDKEIIGICPLISQTIKIHGMDIRNLEFLRIPDTQECEILAAPENYQTVISAITDYLRTAPLKWDRLILRTFPEKSQCSQYLPELTKKNRLSLNIQEHDKNPGVSLQDDWETFYARRSRRLKKGNNYVANRLAKTNKALKLSCLKSPLDDPEKIQHVLDSIIQLSSLSWKNITGLTLDQPGPKEFIQRLTKNANKQGWLIIWTLSLDNKPVAMEYQLAYKGIVSALRADYDPHYDELSPGTYLNWKILQNLFGSEMTYYSMGPGDNKYKLRWAEEFPKLYKIIIYNKTLRGRILAGIDLKLRPAIKNILQRKDR